MKESVSKETEKPLSKAEKKLRRREENRQWMVRNKGGWSDDDPNPRHSQYYRIQLPELDCEWKQFVDAMRMDLKSTFRISGTCNPLLASLLRSALEACKRPRGQFIAVKGEAFQGSVLREVPWCDSTYELAVDNSSLASERGLRRLNHLLVREVALGHLARQELVSMIPANLIDIHRDHAVLDICAAPGSKTEQLLGMMAASNGYGRSAGKGVLVANDIDSKRIGTIQQRLQRSSSPQFILTNGNAAVWSTYLQGSNKEVFDRILCDVPCSGDGTFRKCPHLWRLFRPRLGLEFHEVQVSILRESVRLLKPGGLLAYSTCSLNPLEDEAVLAAVLRRYPDHLELVECPVGEHLPGLQYRPGVSTWRSDVGVFTVGEENDADQAQSQARLPPLSPTMHAPSANERERMGLHRCLRILPHDQNTGGFFIAVLRKVRPLPPPLSKKGSSQILKERGAKADMSSSGEKLTGAESIVTSEKREERNRVASSDSSLQIVNKPSQKKKGAAVDAMVALGYNPKAVDEAYSVGRIRRLDPLVEKDRQEMERVVAQSMGVKGEAWMQEDWQVVEDLQQHTFSILTTSAWEALSTWGSAMPVVQCGVAVGRLRPTDSVLEVEAFNAHRVGRQLFSRHIPAAAVSQAVYRELLQAMVTLCGQSGTKDLEEASSSTPVELVLDLCTTRLDDDTRSISYHGRLCTSSLAGSWGASAASIRPALLPTPPSSLELSTTAANELAAATQGHAHSLPPGPVAPFRTALHLVCEGRPRAGGEDPSTAVAPPPESKEQGAGTGEGRHKRRLSKAEQRKRAKLKTALGATSLTSESDRRDEPEEAMAEVVATEKGAEEEAEVAYARQTFSIPACFTRIETSRRRRCFVFCGAATDQVGDRVAARVAAAHQVTLFPALYPQRL